MVQLAVRDHHLCVSFLFGHLFEGKENDLNESSYFRCISTVDLYTFL